MSVTFAPAKPGPITYHELKTWCDARSTQPITAAPLSAKFAADTHTQSCDKCKSYGGAFIRAVRNCKSVNMSNTNASALLEVLGLAPDFREGLSGSDTAENFLGRTLMALAVLPADEGRPSIVEANVISMGTEPQYTQNRLEALRSIATWCVDNDSDVVWG